MTELSIDLPLASLALNRPVPSEEVEQALEDELQLHYHPCPPGRPFIDKKGNALEQFVLDCLLRLYPYDEGKWPNGTVIHSYHFLSEFRKNKPKPNQDTKQKKRKEKKHKGKKHKKKIDAEEEEQPQKKGKMEEDDEERTPEVGAEEEQPQTTEKMEEDDEEGTLEVEAEEELPENEVEGVGMKKEALVEERDKQPKPEGWNTPGTLTQGEMDFLVIDRDGIIFYIEAKSGQDSGWSQLEKDDEFVRYVVENFIKKSRVARKTAIPKNLNEKLIFCPGLVVAAKLSTTAPEHFAEHVAFAAPELCDEDTFVAAFQEKKKHLLSAHQEELTEKEKMNLFECVSQVFVGLSRLAPRARSVLAEQHFFKKLTQTQCHILEDAPCEVTITGPAGSGKTEVLLQKIKRLQKDFPGDRILYVCYNVALAAYMRKQLGLDPKQEEPNLTQPLVVSTAYSLVNHLQRPPKKFHHVFVDEAQDLFESKLIKGFKKSTELGPIEALKTLRDEEGAGLFWVAFDPNQHLSKEAEKKEMTALFLLESRYLSKIVRCTHQIAVRYQPLYRHMRKTYESHFTPSNFSGAFEVCTGKSPGSIRKSHEYADVAVSVLQTLKDNGHQLCDVVILVPTEAHVATMLKKLDGADFNLDFVNAVDAQALPDNRQCVIVDSCFRFKGLDRPIAVYIDGRFNRPEKDRYVACSRAKSLLVEVVCDFGQRSS
eukprot:m.37425 g.37425  ORF g.37425 m.37425 type:complete len:709 (-) comp11380_c0_seq1:143-2269(-)